MVWKWDNTDPFGKNAPTNLGINFNLRFMGQYFDNETGLFYNYYRYYNPETGRYMQSDPIGLSGGIDTYAYVDQNPLNKVDPLGLAERGLDGKINQYGDSLDFSRSYGGKGAPSYTSVLMKNINIKTDKGSSVEAAVRVTPNFRPSVSDMTTNCHGVTFGDGEMWIDHPEELVNDEYIKLGNTSLAQPGDIAVYTKNDTSYPNGKIPYGEIEHSSTLVPGIGANLEYGKNGYLPNRYLSQIGRHYNNMSRNPTYYRKKINTYIN